MSATDHLGEEAVLLQQAADLAQAINFFRNLPMLGRYGSLRDTVEYQQMCLAWEIFRNTYGHDMAVHPAVRRASP